MTTTRCLPTVETEAFSRAITDSPGAQLKSLRPKGERYFYFGVLEREYNEEAILQCLRFLDQLHSFEIPEDLGVESSDDLCTYLERVIVNAAVEYSEVYEHYIKCTLEEEQPPEVKLADISTAQKEAGQFCQFLQRLVESTTKIIADRLSDNVFVTRHVPRLFEVVDLLREEVVNTTNFAKADCLETDADSEEDENDPSKHESRPEEDKNDPREQERQREGDKRAQAQTLRVGGYLAGERPVQEPKSNNIGAQQHREQKGRKFHSHITLSRDQTASSDFRKELLLILRVSSSELETQKQDQQTGVGAVQLSGPEFAAYQEQQRRYQDQALAFRQALTQHNNSLQQQKIRLEQIHRTVALQKAIDPAMSTVATTKANPSNDVPKEPPAHTRSPEPNLGDLLHRISRLEAENETLKTDQEVLPSFQTFFFIQEPSKDRRLAITSAYLEEPSWSIGPRGEVGLKAHFPVTNIEGYIQEHRSISFVIAKLYSAAFQIVEVQAAIRNKQALPRPEPFDESIRLQSQDMVEAAEQFFGRQPNFSREFPNFHIRGNIPSPYLFWYQYRCPEPFINLSKVHRHHMELLTGWIDKEYGAMYTRVNDQLEKGVVSVETVPFLVKPGDALIHVNKGVKLAYIAASFAARLNPEQSTHSPRPAEYWSQDPDPMKNKLTWSWSVEAWSYKYDGRFYRHSMQQTIKLLVNTSDTEVPIATLELYPARYAPKELRCQLESRGKTYWSCRKQELVAYRDKDGKYGSVRIPLFSLLILAEG